MNPYGLQVGILLLIAIAAVFSLGWQACDYYRSIKRDKKRAPCKKAQSKSQSHYTPIMRNKSSGDSHGRS